jgi:hypothetical protein
MTQETWIPSYKAYGEEATRYLLSIWLRGVELYAWNEEQVEQDD